MIWCCFDTKPVVEKDLLNSQQSSLTLSSLKNTNLFSYNELRTATNNFHASRKLGQGGFGAVYKGTLRNGTLLAAKVLSAESVQGLNQFLTEIDVIANVRHPNLIKLIGCCLDGSKKILVYEYLKNNSLDHALRGLKNGTVKFNWDMRSSICLGTARGLKFLHEDIEPPIVHRDIKASNILLDSNFMPKIGDFGLAKLFPDNITHISTRVAGTLGYLAPEYAMQGQLTKKADIYSFGVVVLEIVSGKRASQMHWLETDKFLIEWAWQLYEEDRLRDLVDPTLREYPEKVVLRYIKVALFCTQETAARRPSMTQVVEMLSKPVLLNEKELIAPKFIQHSVKSRQKLKMLWPTSSAAAEQEPTHAIFSALVPR
ncbi:cold-responsive protein kinase 1-like isoform X1 [Canna indica]|uniref:Cold-responsive protein kinase 1-like isoform X1 n=1 Tax=Canna indica TaxID=4628 RepID=A0AAQ3KFR7_9LILI|nr:cold-responsive protein kinase 1-like isoform X1 [Canna indica]